MKIEKYRHDTELIAQELMNQQYRLFDQVTAENAAFLGQLAGITYIQKTGPGL
jgi:hypothetical protein